MSFIVKRRGLNAGSSHSCSERKYVIVMTGHPKLMEVESLFNIIVQCLTYEICIWPPA